MDDWHLKHPEKRAEYDANRAPHKPPTAAQSRGYRVRYHYGLSPDERAAMFATQDSRCACCGTAETQEREKPWQIDHDHDTLVLRGVVCPRCNRALAQAGDNAACIAVTFSRMLAYLHRSGDTLSPADTETLIAALRTRTACELPNTERVHPDRPIRPQHGDTPTIGRKGNKFRDQGKPKP